MTYDFENTISVDQLQVGVYVYLDVGWMHHPFGFNNFKIRSNDQLSTIRQLGLKSVRWDPLRSDHAPLPLPDAVAVAVGSNSSAVPALTEASAAVPLAGAVPANPALSASIAAGTTDKTGGAAALDNSSMMSAKQARIKQLTEYRASMLRVEQAFMSSIETARRVNQTIFSQPAQTRFEAGQLVGQMVDALLSAPEIAIQVMGAKPLGEDVYVHSLNVSVLAMILGRELKLPAELVRAIGFGALFHDVGLTNIPAKIVNNPGALNKVERDFRQMHCEYGVAIGKNAGLPPAVLDIILQHHEHADGSGYPRQIKGDSIDLLARVVCLVNAYDNLCNPLNVAQALTPHEALSQIFSQQRSRYDGRLLKLFIRFMGVYPPGTVVSLSNEAIGLVIAVNAARPLKPKLMIYDPQTPRHEALILDLEDEPDINIAKALRPGQLLPEVCDYLGPRRRVSYYFDADTGASATSGRSA
jgi:putative nucleotidyltransferase with HDIG domain